MVEDKDGNYYQVSTEDERYLSGELSCYWLGKKHTEETKKKITLRTCWITNGIENDKIKSDDKIKSGWRLGRTVNKNINYCKCGGVMDIRAKICRKCYNDQYNANKPNYEELILDIENLGYMGSSKKYNVSSTTIRNWTRN